MKSASLAIAAMVGLSAAAAPIEWHFPRLASCHEGLPFSDGVTGVLVWGGGDELRLTVGRADLWDHRGGYPWTPEQNYTNVMSLVKAGDKAALKRLFYRETPKNWNPGGNPFTDRFNPYLLPLGRVVIRLRGATLVRGELDTETGLGRIFLSDGRAIGLAMSVPRRAFAMKFPEGLGHSAKSVPATDFPVYENLLKWRGFEKAKVADAADGSRGGFSWQLPEDPSVTLAWSRKGGDFVLRTARGGETASSEDAAYETVRRDSVAHWTRFWQEGARVRVPDRQLQEAFDLGMYKFGAMTDPKGVPPGLQGPWLEDDRLVPWNGDYHFNINIQECYSPAYRGGHFAHLKPLFKMVLSWRPILRNNARRFVGIENGYVLPHSVDDRGVCIGGFWSGTIDHASTAWVAALMMRYVRYSGDVAFLKEGGFDYMKGAMNVYRAMMEERGGRLSLPLGPSPEWGGETVQSCVGRDPSFQLAAAHRLARDCAEAARIVGERADPMWADVDARLPAYTSGPGGIQLFEGQPFTESHRHHSHLAGFYPFDTIDLSDPAARKTAEATYETWIARGMGAWTGWCVPWASILETHFGHATAAASRLRDWATFFCDPGHGSHHDACVPGFTLWWHRHDIMQMDGQCAAVTAILELMAHEVNGRVEFFRGCPESWRDVSFENLALSDGRRVSGRRLDGRVTVEACGAPRQN